MRFVACCLLLSPITFPLSKPRETRSCDENQRKSVSFTTLINFQILFRILIKIHSNDDVTCATVAIFNQIFPICKTNHRKLIISFYSFLIAKTGQKDWDLTQFRLTSRIETPISCCLSPPYDTFPPLFHVRPRETWCQFKLGDKTHVKWYF